MLIYRGSIYAGKIHRLFFFIFLLCFTISFKDSFADASFKPYFASIKSSEVNVRIGPNVRYPIKWVFVKKYEPLEVIASFEHWYKIRDVDGEEGWVKSSMVSPKRFVITKGSHYIDMMKNYDSNIIIAKLEPLLRLELVECKEKYCLAKTAKIKGWIERKYLWGVYKSEFNE